ncbi:N-acetylneuraminate synthase [Metabacillus idriensis]|uniref:N-acetylneuraminate synthase n=1 Tax=Metabacillus idriensis TaxID=324768 RepID=UPI002812CB19|nr:N-acetylneuraminate synthase [Metabacillus idriensis]MDR0138026.1 N-acetylneuraminate synthase [Metabacillus idriensis]
MCKTFIIAEAGVNHNGSIQLGKELIEGAAKAGADAIKFQTFVTDYILTDKAAKADYQMKSTDPAESQIEMVKKLELSPKMHEELIEHCKKNNIQFLSTPFDEPSVDLLVHTFNIPILKIASGEITNAPLLLKMARMGKPIILSTGVSTIADVEKALGVLAFGYQETQLHTPSIEAFEQAFCSEEGQKLLQTNVTLLHCTSEYPAPFCEVNLNVMDTLRQTFSLPVGYSDHTKGIAVPIAAVAKGAVVIEKHITLDCNLPGPDHKASLELEEFAEMVSAIRQVEASLGQSLKIPSFSEVRNKSVIRKSIVTSRKINKGETFTADKLTIKRPGDGLSPFYYWDYIGRTANKTHQKNEQVFF